MKTSGHSLVGVWYLWATCSRIESNCRLSSGSKPCHIPLGRPFALIVRALRVPLLATIAPSLRKVELPIQHIEINGLVANSADAFPSSAVPRKALVCQLFVFLKARN